MSEKVISEIKPAHAVSVPIEPVEESAPALRPEVMQILDFIDADLTGGVRTDNSLSYEGRMGPTSIRIDSVEAVATDGTRILETVHISTDVSGWVHLPVEQVALANRYAGLAALIRDPVTGKLSLETRTTLYEGFDDTLEYSKYVFLCALAIHDAGLAAAINREFLQPNEPRWQATQLPGHDRQGRWNAEEFEEAATILRSRRYFANAGQARLTAEFPWEDGAVSAANGHATNLLTYSGLEQHPTLGRGLFCKLELYPRFPSELVAELANSLNAFERDAVNAAPLFGAWCLTDRTGGLAYVEFWPNYLHNPNLLRNLALWMSWRSHVVREVFENGRV